MSEQKITIGIAGASGFVGRNLIDNLLEEMLMLLVLSGLKRSKVERRLT